MMSDSEEESDSSNSFDYDAYVQGGPDPDVPRRVTLALDWVLDDSLRDLRYSSDPLDIEDFRGRRLWQFRAYMYTYGRARQALITDAVENDATYERMKEFLDEINDYVDDFNEDGRLDAIDTREVWKMYCAIVVYNIMYARMTGQDVAANGGKVIIPYERLPDSDNEQYE